MFICLYEYIYCKLTQSTKRFFLIYFLVVVVVVEKNQQ